MLPDPLPPPLLRAHPSLSFKDPDSTRPAIQFLEKRLRLPTTFVGRRSTSRSASQAGVAEHTVIPGELQGMSQLPVLDSILIP
jgi:hypothetical protein